MTVEELRKLSRKAANDLGFEALCQLHGLPSPEAEYRFHPTRRWRADYAFHDLKLLVEIEGGAFSSGRHSRGAGFEKDIEKYAEAMCLGWRVLRVTPKMVKDGRAFDWIKRITGGGY